MFFARFFIKDSKNYTNSVVRNNYGKFSSIVSIIFNIVLFAFKLIAGVISGSVGIMADAFNNLSDASSSIISFVGFFLSSKPADSEHPYGHGRYEYLSALMVAVLVCAIGIELFTTSLDKIFNPTEVKFSLISWVVLIGSILVKLYMMFFNRKIGKLISSQTLIATSNDSRNDVITTSAVLVSSFIGSITNIQIDGYVGSAVAVFIVVSGLLLVKDTLNPILGSSPTPELVKSIHDKIMSYENIEGTHDLMVHDYGPGKIFASAHVEMNAEIDTIISHDIIDNIENSFKEELGIEIILHYDPIYTDDEKISDLRKFLKDIVTEIDPSFSVHDVRFVEGVTHSNVIFDCVIPPENACKSNDIKRQIIDQVQKVHPDYNCVITIDRSYVEIN
ncbi:MAG: cation diffusion facilitator family transporter [Saccharofermentanaceae bacterium]|jgi:cation diffusion facilitator family transporter|nr:cation transporter [Clostridia bacterium]NLX68811.1 cation transporter [Clostridiaceae bacterium]HOO48257.1 cation diffusion facilitator family transporter [Saccharofermentans sp.]HPE27888.1 cation diffusion facilitator family transporter [Saccharofermentans sp.]HPG64335.1 cation diffusion facilitator family transporter [Saccharofermentans sp.]